MVGGFVQLGTGFLTVEIMDLLAGFFGTKVVKKQGPKFYLLKGPWFSRHEKVIQHDRSDNIIQTAYYF